MYVTDILLSAFAILLDCITALDKPNVFCMKAIIMPVNVITPAEKLKEIIKVRVCLELREHSGTIMTK